MNNIFSITLKKGRKIDFIKLEGLVIVLDVNWGALALAIVCILFQSVRYILYEIATKAADLLIKLAKQIIGKITPLFKIGVVVAVLFVSLIVKIVQRAVQNQSSRPNP